MREHMANHMGYVEWKRFRAEKAMKPQAIRWAIAACFSVAALAAMLIIKLNGGTL